MIPAHALKLAKTAQHKFHRHVAFVMKGGAIMSWGVNRGWRHAEVAAMGRVWWSKRAGTTVISIRLRRDGKMGMSKPCLACQAFLKEQKVKHVVYIDSEGVLARMKL